MWNFTVRGLLVPNVDEVEDLLKSKETAEEPQHSLKDVKAQDTFIGGGICFYFYYISALQRLLG